MSCKIDLQVFDNEIYQKNKKRKPHSKLSNLNWDDLDNAINELKEKYK